MYRGGSLILQHELVSVPQVLNSDSLCQKFRVGLSLKIVADYIWRARLFGEYNDTWMDPTYTPIFEIGEKIISSFVPIISNIKIGWFGFSIYMSPCFRHLNSIIVSNMSIITSTNKFAEIYVTSI